MNTNKTLAFRQDMIDLILAGKKTIALVPMIPQPEEFFLHVGETCVVFYAKKGGHQLYTEKQVSDGNPLGKVGDIVTVRDRPDIKLRVTDIHFCKAQELTKSDREKIGLSDLSEDSICAYWNSFHEGTEYRWENDPWVFGIEFELVKEDA